MEKNLGNIDKIIRISIAIIVSALLLWGVVPETLALILLIPAGILILTSMAGLCPLYLAFGISTYKRTSNSKF